MVPAVENEKRSPANAGKKSEKRWTMKKRGFRKKGKGEEVAPFILGQVLC
jgi:hypothetical protein